MVTIAMSPTAMSENPGNGAASTHPTLAAALDNLAAAGITFTEVHRCPEPACPLCAPASAHPTAA